MIRIWLVLLLAISLTHGFVPKAPAPVGFDALVMANLCGGTDPTAKGSVCPACVLHFGAPLIQPLTDCVTLRLPRNTPRFRALHQWASAVRQAHLPPSRGPPWGLS